MKSHSDSRNKPAHKVRRKPVAIAVPAEPDFLVRARLLDRTADLELAMGHSQIAERLSRLADAVRGAVR